MGQFTNANWDFETRYFNPGIKLINMKLKITAFGIAKDIIGERHLELELPDQLSIGELKNKLIGKFPDFEKLASLNFAVDEEYQSDDFMLADQHQVIIIPPVSGG